MGIFVTVLDKEEEAINLRETGERVEEFGWRNEASMVVKCEIIKKGKKNSNTRYVKFIINNYDERILSEYSVFI